MPYLAKSFCQAFLSVQARFSATCGCRNGFEQILLNHGTSPCIEYGRSTTEKTTSALCRSSPPQAQIQQIETHRNRFWIAHPFYRAHFTLTGGAGFSHVVALADGGYLVAGSRETQFPDERRKFNATLSRLASDGTAVWQRSFPGDSHTGINGLAEGRDGTAIAVGAIVDAETNNSDAWVFTFTLDGEFPKAVTVERY